MSDKGQAEVTVLFLDRRSIAVQQFRKVLTTVQFKAIRHVNSVRDALREINQQIPALIFSEWELEDHTIIEFLKVIRSNEKWAEIPVYVYTSEIRNDRVRAAKSVGIQSYFLKSKDSEKVGRLIQRAVSVEKTAEKEEVTTENRQLIAAKLRSQLKHIEKLAPLPTIAQTVFRLISDQNSSAHDLAAVIDKDQSLTARILKIVNSAYYGFSRQIGNINHGIVILGFTEVKNITMAACILDAFKEEVSEEFNRYNFWVHSIGVAYAARELSERIPGINRDDAFVAGLLHDIGKVILDQHFNRYFRMLLKEAKGYNAPLFKSEDALYGINHAEIGEIVSHSWNLPQSLERAVGLHHTPGAATPNEHIIHLVHVANVLCHRNHIGSSGTALAQPINPGSLEHLGIEAAELGDIWESLEIDEEKITMILKS
ncbi:HDOD domain-containing protein [bacterium]|nr:HDOD domain-containing protein [bacterium]